MADFKTASVVVGLLLLSGCVDQGRPLVTDRSPVFDEPNPSVVPASKTKAPKRRQPSTRVPTREASSKARPPARISVIAPYEYLVRRGESLYSIAWRFELDHVRIARLNRISPPYVIQPGQLLKLRPPQSNRQQPATVKSRPAPAPAVSPKNNGQTVANPPSRKPAASKTVKKPTPVKPRVQVQAGRWQWPVANKPQRAFGRASKGLDFVLTQATAVRACNSGEVVYAGNGIGGFAHLVILRHDQDLLSAYSFNGETRIEEGDVVKAGQKIADIKTIGQSSQKLHFELRRKGQPINPGTMIK